MRRIRIGISSCLMGMEVRHDGGHKRNKYVINNLSDHFEFTPFCPEVAAGLGTPRPAIHLTKRGESIRLVEVKNHHADMTDAMLETSADYVSRMDGLSGYILKKDSPSCGMARVRLWNEHGQADRVATGLFAQALMDAHPHLPIEEEGRLMDAVLRENFIERVYVYARWQELERSGLSPRGLMAFHRNHKLTLLAHDEVTYRKLGPLVAKVRPENIDEVAQEYIGLLMQALKKPATRKTHTNALMHAVGHLKKVLERDEKAEMNELLEHYRTGLVPLVVPITLLKHHLRKNPAPYIEAQHYLQPYPETLMLRNSV